MRLFDCEPTDRERKTLRTDNRRAQGALFDADPLPDKAASGCPACGGTGDGCSCSSTGAEALDLFAP